jgi:Calcineurin-like phosphoesterase
MKSIIDPRQGDIEDDASSTKRRSLFAIAGSLLAEISLPRLLASWMTLIGIPGLLLGLAPLVASGWLATVSRKIATSFAEISSLALLLFVVALGALGGRPLFRLTERSFWSLNALAVQPCYALCREAMRHLAERALSSRATEAEHAALRAMTAAAAGVAIGVLASGLVLLAWPFSRWIGSASDLASPLRLLLPAVANSVVLLGSYFAAAALVWGIADATMGQPRDLDEFDTLPDGGRVWRVAHLSDLHVVGERYGWRIESGRSGPQGNDRLRRALAQLDALHSENPLDVVLITGDMTDAGRSAEWAEFLDALALHPRLAERVLVVPGNHDLNVVDRANPARLDLPTSPSKRLRQIRALAAIAALQGERVRVVDHAAGHVGGTLAETLAPRLSTITRFADTGSFRLSRSLADLWADVFPMVFPPDREDGLGILLLNSNAETHFSFTNALGMVPAAQARGVEIAAAHYPRASWLVVLHHHLVEYPSPATAFSERIGTALINGSWFIRKLQRLADRTIVMHGHRHTDWIGKCGGLVIVSAPSPVMETTDEVTSCFYVHSMVTGVDGRLRLLSPKRIDVGGQPVADAVGGSLSASSCDRQSAVAGLP